MKITNSDKAFLINSILSYIGINGKSLYKMKENFPEMFSFDPLNTILPKVLFLIGTVLKFDFDNVTKINQIASFPHYFGHSLVKSIALRHAFLCYKHRYSYCYENVLDNNCEKLKEILTFERYI